MSAIQVLTWVRNAVALVAAGVSVRFMLQARKAVRNIEKIRRGQQ